MWLSKQGRTPPRPEETARVGRVTLPDDPAGVWTGSERRDVAVFGPGGYAWRPAAGEEVLVLKAGEEACLAGVRCPGVPEPGEVWITGPGGSATSSVARPSRPGLPRPRAGAPTARRPPRRPPPPQRNCQFEAYA